MTDDFIKNLKQATSKVDLNSKPLDGDWFSKKKPNAKLASQSYDDKFEQMKNKSVYAKLGAYENIRVFSRILTDSMQKTVGEDKYVFIGSMNDVEDLQEALNHFDMDYREESYDDAGI